MIPLKYRKCSVVMGLVLVFLVFYLMRRKSDSSPNSSVVNYINLLKKLKTYKQDAVKNSVELKELKKLAPFKVESRDGIYSGLCPLGHVRIGEYCFPDYDQEEVTVK